MSTPGTNRHSEYGPQVYSTDLTLHASILSTGWQSALRRSPVLKVVQLVPSFSKPHAVSMILGRDAVSVSSFLFVPPGSDSTETQFGGAGQAASRSAFDSDDGPNAIPITSDTTVGRPSGMEKIGPVSLKPTDGRTRIHPPRDVVKLEDRLFYVLQPPLETMLSGPTLQFPVPPFPYQLQGVAFLYPRYAAILADEMGLGKTMQAITAMRLLLRTGQVRSVLLFCPKPLVPNWQREFAGWAPELPVTVIEGDQSRRDWQWQLTNVPVRIANYELLIRDREILDQHGLQFDLVLLDEAQRIKNRSSHTSQVVRSVTRQRSWALTGTPVENSPDDLVGIFEFLSPGYLRAGTKPAELGRAVRDYILRRTKSEVLADLPPKLFRDARVELSPAQREAYRMAEDDGVLRLTQMGKGITIQHVFELVLRLKQICNFDLATGESTKLERMVVDLEEVAASGRKALVFSQWVQTLRILRHRLARFRPLEYHGQVPHRRRGAVLDEFRRDDRCHVLLISYGAGGVGLNLQLASYVFLFDRWWNPAVEDQAINRAHRLGTSRPVTITRMVTVGTIEERIDDVLCRKRELADTILAETGPPQSMGLSQEEIFGLFNLGSPATRRDDYSSPSAA